MLALPIRPALFSLHNKLEGPQIPFVRFALRFRRLGLRSRGSPRLRPGRGGRGRRAKIHHVIIRMLLSNILT